MFALYLKILVRDHRYDHCRGDENPIEEDRETVYNERAVESLGRAVGRQVRLLVPQGGPRKRFAGDQDECQALTLPRFGKDHKIEQQDGAPEQRQHHRRNEGKIIGFAEELVHWPLTPGPRPLTPGAGRIAACAPP